MIMKWGKYWKAAVVVLNLFLILFMVYVIASSAGYTVFLGDDFTNGVRIGVFHAPFFQYAAASLSYMKDMYLDWQGTYFAMFIQAFLSPINNFGLMQLKMVMIANALLFFVSLFGVVWTLLGFVWRDKGMTHAKLTIFTVILFSILDADVFTEIFFWYTGATAYCIPMSFMLLAVMCLLISNNDCYSKKTRTVSVVFSAILIFLVGGGTLAISGTGCYVVLLLTLGFCLVSRKISVSNIIVLAAGIIGSLINVVAPGNFARHTYSSGGTGSWRLVQSVKWAVKNVWSEIERLTRETMFSVMILVMVMLGVYLSHKIEKVLKEYGIISVLALGWGYVTTFPVALGYGGPEFPNRCCFLLDVVLVFSLLNFAVFMGCCLDRWANLYADKRACAVLIVVVFMTFLQSPESISESSLLAVARSKHNGSYENYYQECKAVYDYLESCPEEDVVLEMPDYIENFECFYFDEDENGWVNVGLARYYHKNSVRRKAE
ncbi:MAG: DUF6056 family protein [Eubacterium sp.]|nr:DUF6056 family protein [Eubacterium sp.]